MIIRQFATSSAPRGHTTTIHPLPAETRLRELARAVTRDADEMETTATTLRPDSTAATLLVSHARRLLRLVALWADVTEEAQR